MTRSPALRPARSAGESSTTDRRRRPRPGVDPSPLNSTAGSVSSCARPRTSSSTSRVAPLGSRTVSSMRPSSTSSRRIRSVASSHVGVGLAADRLDLVARLEDRRARRQSPARRRASIGFRACTPRHEHQPVGEDREQEIEGGAGQQHRDPLPDGALMERAVAFLGDDGPFVLVEHLDVAAERDRRQPILNVIGRTAAPRQQRPAEADREAQHFEAEPPRHDEVAELVRGDQHADRDDEPQRSFEYRKVHWCALPPVRWRPGSYGVVILAGRSSAGHDNSSGCSGHAARDRGIGPAVPGSADELQSPQADDEHRDGRRQAIDTVEHPAVARAAACRCP